MYVYIYVHRCIYISTLLYIVKFLTSCPLGIFICQSQFPVTHTTIYIDTEIL